MKRGSDWSPIYMLLVVVIAAILIITLIKPVFQNASSSAASNLITAQKVAASGLFMNNPAQIPSLPAFPRLQLGSSG